MGSFGERLRRERQKRGITLESVSASTKIRPHNLQALEKEEFDKLPGGIFNKGFVRSYARFLEMNEEDVLKEFIEAAGDPEQPLPAPPAPPDMPEAKHRSPLARMSVIAVCAVVLLGFACWGLWSIRHIARTRSHVHSANSRSAAITNSPDKNNESSTSLEVPRALSATNQSENNVTATLQPASQTTTIPVPGAVSASVSTDREKFIFLARAKKPTWVSITADGKPVFEGVLKRKKKLHALSEVVLKTTNAGALAIARNGTPLPPLGAEDQHTTVIVTPDRVTKQDTVQSAASE